MSNSKLVDCTLLSPNHSGERKHSIDRITPHCVVGQLKAENIGGCFKSTSVKASCNYGIGTEGRVCLIVPEQYRSWCTSSNANDQRAITIECASEKVEPYKFNSKVYRKLIELTIEIMRRHKKTKLVYIADKNKALKYEPTQEEMLLTFHRWFANKSCPGNWFVSRAEEFTREVNSRLGGVNIENNNVDIKNGSVVKLKSGSTQYDGNSIKREYVNKEYVVKQVTGDRAVLTIDGVIVYAVNTKDLILANKSYTVVVDADVLNVRSGPSVDTMVVTSVSRGEVYTIVEEHNGWGRLKSGAGWVYLKYTRKR